MTQPLSYRGLASIENPQTVMRSVTHPRIYDMAERSDRLDFYIREQASRPAIQEPHRHAYFQIQLNLAGNTTQRVDGTTRPFPTGALAFILPYRIHSIPHPPGARFIVINFSRAFLGTNVEIDPLNFDEVPIQSAPELAPFVFQEKLDFILTGTAFDEARQLATRMLAVDRERRFGSAIQLRGHLLQLIGLACSQQAEALEKLTQASARPLVQSEALMRAMRHVRANLTNFELTLSSTAAATFLSPNYLSHVIRKETGSTFTELVTARRVSLARTLLMDTALPIAEVARSVGFRDEAYFSRRFHALVGLSPKDFRKHGGLEALPRA